MLNFTEHNEFLDNHIQELDKIKTDLSQLNEEMGGTLDDTLEEINEISEELEVEE